MKENLKAKALLEKYTDGLCSEEEKSMVENWYSSLPDAGPAPDYDQIVKSKQEIWYLLSVKQFGNYKFNYLKYICVAAALLICLGTGIYFSHILIRKDFSKEISAKTDIVPGGNKATLTFGDGTTIILDDAAKGELATRSGMSVTKNGDGQLTFVVREASLVNPNVLNSIVTPRGGQYRMVLPDGTKVWLNASSSLKFPSAFTGNERKVQLMGEAYFEVVKNRAIPFKVFSGNQQVVVLGTHFNINSYADEPSVKTTLFEGSVQVSSISNAGVRILKPGQQSVFRANTIDVNTVDLEEALAWKNGLFVFNNEDLESIMRKVSRWYNVNVIYKDDEVRKEVFGGSVSRFVNISETLRMLEITGNAHFKIEAGQIIVMKK